MRSNEKLKSGQSLPLMETFFTIQGEGANTGMPAQFIRLGGCDVGCHWCDVKESWDARLYSLVPAEKLVEDISIHNVKNAVITGGEPLMYKLDFLTAKLKNSGIKTYLETSGAYPLSGTWDWICLSPKKRKIPLKDIYPEINELKIIIYNMDDFRFALECLTFLESKFIRPKFPALYLQPEWTVREKILPAIIDFIKKNDRWRLSLQSHKYIGVP